MNALIELPILLMEAVGAVLVLVSIGTLLYGGYNAWYELEHAPARRRAERARARLQARRSPSSGYARI